MDEPITPTQRGLMTNWVREILGSEKAAVWWQTANPMLGGMKPWHMTLMPRWEAKLYRFIKDNFENCRSADSAGPKQT